VAFEDNIGSIGSLLEQAAGYLAAEHAYYERITSETRAKLRNCSTEELLGMLDHYDFRLAQVVKAKMGRGGWTYRRGKIIGAREIPELGQLKLILQRLSTMDTGGSFLESLRVMTMIAILQQIVRNIQGLVG